MYRIYKMGVMLLPREQMIYLFGVQVFILSTYNIVQWNLLPTSAILCTTVDGFKEQISISALSQIF